jgi:hypothetical protein
MTCDVNCGAVFSLNKQIHFILIAEALRKCDLLIVKILAALLTKLGSFPNSIIKKK